MRLAPIVAALFGVSSFAFGQAPNQAPANTASSKINTGNALFQQNCAFCHGRDAAGGETGPDLTRSKLVTADVNGDKIAPVIRNGIPDRGMPKFALPDNDIAALVAFIHEQKKAAESQIGGRRGVDPSDLQTGNAPAGRAYFDANCASCHSPEKDLAGIAKRYEGLSLERRFLFPQKTKARVTVTLPSGETVAGVLAFRDEFTVALRDATGRYRSWSTGEVKYKVDTPVNAHVELLAKYSDDDIHNLMAYLQTLK